MSFVTAHPEALMSAADNLSGTGFSLASTNTMAQAPTIGVLPPSADEVSAMLAARFATQAQLYHQVSVQAAAIHEMFVANLNGSANTYAAAEATNAIAAG
ncbi:PE family protein [[Mycobacterium] nativiensis]|uniref:PE family protein n=1 Tax=[Mycobacterium] nativiensis TaxID=2855503 RepID=A0ABU5XSB9_9MYCO|nr:PE family protein [Mycolicibacter sp. MYC340]MEB3030838.1 PE family protein [Mycolicibacter sp. MYC340]